MKRRMTTPVKAKIALGNKASQGVQRPIGSVATPSQKSFESTKNTKSVPNRFGGREGKKEVPHRIDEFHPRGSAGRREVSGLKGARKLVLPTQGRRTKNPK